MPYRQTAAQTTAATAAALNARLENVEASVARLSSKMDNTATAADVHALHIKLDNLQKPKDPQYGIWMGAASLIITLMVGYFSVSVGPIKDAISKNDADTRVSIEKIDTNSRLARREITEDLKEIRTAIVPRGEHEQRWRSFETQVVTLNNRIDEVRKTQAELYSPKDAFKDLQKQIDDIRSSILKEK